MDRFVGLDAKQSGTEDLARFHDQLPLLFGQAVVSVVVSLRNDIEGNRARVDGRAIEGNV